MNRALVISDINSKEIISTEWEPPKESGEGREKFKLIVFKFECLNVHCSATVLWFAFFFSDDKSDVIFIFVPLYIMCPFSPPLSLSFKSFLFIIDFKQFYH